MKVLPNAPKYTFYVIHKESGWTIKEKHLNISWNNNSNREIIEKFKK